MRRTLSLTIALAILASCGRPDAPAAPQSDVIAEFNRLAAASVPRARTAVKVLERQRPRSAQKRPR